MNYLVTLLIALTVGLVGCGESTVTQEDYDSMVYEKDLKISELESQVSQMQEYIASSSLKSCCALVSALYGSF